MDGFLFIDMDAAREKDPRGMVWHKKRLGSALLRGTFATNRNYPSRE
jgi:hypothetical protein